MLAIRSGTRSLAQPQSNCFVLDIKHISACLGHFWMDDPAPFWSLKNQWMCDLWFMFWVLENIAHLQHHCLASFADFSVVPTSARGTWWKIYLYLYQSISMFARSRKRICKGIKPWTHSSSMLQYCQFQSVALSLLLLAELKLDFIDNRQTLLGVS